MICASLNRAVFIKNLLRYLAEKILLLNTTNFRGDYRGSLHDLVYCRGEYDVVATVEAPDLDSMTALKLAMMKTGAIAQMSVLESIDLNAVARQGANLIGAYKAPGN